MPPSHFLTTDIIYGRINHLYQLAVICGWCYFFGVLWLLVKVAISTSIFIGFVLLKGLGFEVVHCGDHCCFWFTSARRFHIE